MCKEIIKTDQSLTRVSFQKRWNFLTQCGFRVACWSDSVCLPDKRFHH